MHLALASTACGRWCSHLCRYFHLSLFLNHLLYVALTNSLTLCNICSVEGSQGLYRPTMDQGTHRPPIDWKTATIMVHPPFPRLCHVLSRLLYWKARMGHCWLLVLENTCFVPTLDQHMYCNVDPDKRNLIVEILLICSTINLGGMYLQRLTL